MIIKSSFFTLGDGGQSYSLILVTGNGYYSPQNSEFDPSYNHLSGNKTDKPLTIYVLKKGFVSDII